MTNGLNLDYSLLIPEYILGGLAVVLIYIDLAMPRVKKSTIPLIAAGGLAVAFIASLFYIDTSDNFANLIFIDDYTTFFRCFFIGVAFAIVVASANFVERASSRRPGHAAPT